MVGCDVNNCLYASGYGNSCIYKVSLGKNSMSLWSASKPQGLSVTNSHNLLVALSGYSYSLHEYSTDGVYMRRISLPLDISDPVYAVQLSDDHYAVIHVSPAQQFSIINSHGQLVQSYCGDAGDMNEPRGIAADKQGRVFVADQKNNRILTVSGRTLSAYPLPLSDNCTLDGPYNLHYDSINGRLYIGETSGGRVVCCKI